MHPKPLLLLPLLLSLLLSLLSYNSNVEQEWEVSICNLLEYNPIICADSFISQSEREFAQIVKHQLRGTMNM